MSKKKNRFFDRNRSGRNSMKNNRFKNNPLEEDMQGSAPAQENTEKPVETPEEVVNEEASNEHPEDEEAREIEKLKEEVAKEKKEYLFLMAEFDNFRKRTLKEKSEIIKNAGENVLKGLLPIIDDFERGLKAAEKDEASNGVTEGMQLIYNKLIKYLAANGVKEFDPEDHDFDTEKHEAISVVPVPDESMKGKILDTIEKGYMINDKVLRHAKVVVGQ